VIGVQSNDKHQPLHVQNICQDHGTKAPKEDNNKQHAKQTEKTRGILTQDIMFNLVSNVITPTWSHDKQKWITIAESE
jgi:hypothetical protein